MTSPKTRCSVRRHRSAGLVAEIITSALRGAQAFSDLKAQEKKLAIRDEIHITRPRGVRGGSVIVDRGTSRSMSVEDLRREAAVREAKQRQAYADLFARQRFELTAADA